MGVSSSRLSVQRVSRHGGIASGGVQSLNYRKLSDFWPRRGPVWDASAENHFGRTYPCGGQSAHRERLASPETKASLTSLELIQRSLAEHDGSMPRKPRQNGREALDDQYANRLALHFLFRKLNRLPSHLVFLYFINANDVNGPARSWNGRVRPSCFMRRWDLLLENCPKAYTRFSLMRVC